MTYRHCGSPLERSLAPNARLFTRPTPLHFFPRPPPRPRSRLVPSPLCNRLPGRSILNPRHNNKPIATMSTTATTTTATATSAAGATAVTTAASDPATAARTITAQNVSQLFPDVDQSIIRPPPPPGSSEATAGGRGTTNGVLAGYDEEQIRLMDEVCIVLDVDDNPIGSASKKTCHLMTNISRGLLHRAFSVFLFDPSNHKLLLQQRADSKITFPGMWTNTCCSHPLGVPSEAGMDVSSIQDTPPATNSTDSTTEDSSSSSNNNKTGKDGEKVGLTPALSAAVQGVRRAAQRKLGHELGIPAPDVPVSNFDFLTRIHYGAGSDATWGEHEIDYILFTLSTPQLDPNPNEVKASRYVSQDQLRAMLADDGLRFTPWFKLICESGMLFEWWDGLVSGELARFRDGTGIARM